MANYRQEFRPVTTNRPVGLVDCDNCGKTEQTPEDSGTPAGWFLVTHNRTVVGVFCSKACLTQWAASDHPTSAELTAMARKAFKKTTGQEGNG